MNNLEKLLEGVEVEWRPLGEICNTVTDFVAAGSFADMRAKVKYLDTPNYAQLVRTTDLKSNFSNNNNFVYVSESAFNFLWRVNLDKDYIILPNIGNCGEVYYITPNLLPYNKNVLGPNAILIRSNKYNNRFLFYIFHTPDFQNQLYRITSQTGQTKFNKTELKKLSIPIPPLEIQEEIVRILDKFSTLTAELQAELQARKSQYEYYRNQLLDYPMEESDQPSLRSSGSAPSIKESDNQIQQQSAQNHPTDNSVSQPQGKVQWKTLGEIGRFYGGLTGKSKDDFTNGNAKFITYKNVYANPSLNLDIKETVRIYDGERQHTLKYADIIFTGSSETPDECGLSSVVTERIDEKLYLNSFCFFLRLFDTGIIIPTFAKHLFRSKYLRQQISRTASGVTRFNVSKKLMEKVLIPIPPIKEQERIAFILDKFDTLTNSISEGLPKEIELRQKQYEYYRDKLLTFPQR